MELVTHKKYKGDRLMPWGKGTVVTGAKGFVFLAGNTGTPDDYNPVGGVQDGGRRCGRRDGPMEGSADEH